MSNINIVGDANGKFNVFTFTNPYPLDISTYNASLCSVQRVSNSQYNIIEYRPDIGLNPFTQFVPGSGYIVKAKQSFTILGPTPTPFAEPTQTPTPTPTSTPVPATPTPTPVPTAAPTSTPTSTPAPSFSFFVSGPAGEDAPNQISLTSPSGHRFYYNAWPGSSTTYLAVLPRIGGTQVANISYTSDRNGTLFGYSTSGTSYTHLGTFADGFVDLTPI